MASVERVQRPSVSQFRRAFVRARRPVVVTGALDDWRARDWTFDGLAARLGDRQVQLAVLHRGHVPMDGTLVYERGALADYLARVRDAAPVGHYLRLPLAGEPSLRDDVRLPPYAVGSIFRDVGLFIGGVGTITDTHYDMLHNLVAQVRGRRRVTLFAPADAPCLYPFPLRSMRWHCAQVAVERPDLAAFPRFRDATPLRVELAPGELLFIPRGWWHHFEILAPSIGVHCFWLTPRLVPALAAARAVWLLARTHPAADARAERAAAQRALRERAGRAGEP